ncbi:histidine phosphatase family protein [Hyphomicrobium sp.]|uniref:histidine phosphatase family protein n=1 Tax=Hyphomicrobium sp. TaxID=82 RepID=UPI000F9AF256|nr:histidine phosphatase family protein [Hyphomicrobium sp.]RUP08085.1 MAG: histidine phosphatase family protein [Hyphomicrobium sp.]
MQSRLTFIASASTPAVRAAAFPLDEGIDDFGKRDAAALAKELRRPGIVLTSPAARATETAAALGFEQVIDEGLRDLDLGRWAGHTLNDIAASEPEALQNWLSDPAAVPHGGESVEGLIARMAIWLNDVLRRQQNIIAITHPAVMRAAIVASINAGPASFWHLDIAPLSVLELGSNGKRWTLRALKQ